MADRAPGPGSPPPADDEVSAYFRTRLAPNAHRAAVWNHLCAYLQRWILTNADVLELGAGWCDFANTITARRVVAMDVDTTVRSAAAEHVQAEVGDCTDLSRFDSGSFDVVFASNLLEHLERPATALLLAESARVLRSDGILILLQPNFRLNPGGYFDDYTHVAIYTDRSLADYLRSEDWHVVQVFPRFLPLTLNSKGSALTFLVPWYLRSPIKPLAGQMLLIATPSPAVWNGKTLSVVLPTYNEKDSIAETIRAFDKLGIVDDILVVNNNAAEGTSDEVAMTTAREVLEPEQGYGAAIRRGLAEVDTDLICICEPDGTFDPRDLTKLLPFTEDCDLVVGSRTVSTFIWDGANMGRFLQWGNWAVAKAIEVLFNTSYLSDVGCTFRVVSNDLVPGLLRDSRIHGSAFGLEMLMLALVARDTVVQIPVNYHPRVGTSAVTGDTRTAIRLGLRMLRMVLVMRIRPPSRPQRPTRRRSQDQAERQQALWNPSGSSDHGSLGR